MGSGCLVSPVPAEKLEYHVEYDPAVRRRQAADPAAARGFLPPHVATVENRVGIERSQAGGEQD